MVYQYKNFGLTTLNEALDDTETGVDVVNAASFPTEGDFVINVEGELMKVTAVTSNTFTVTRGVEGTTAVPHPLGATVKNVLTADMVATLAPDTGWHEVGGTGEPAFENSWVNYGGSFNTAAFRRIGNVVYLKGLIRDGTIPADAFSLPTGYRPPGTCIFAALDTPGPDSTARVDVYDTDGDVYVSGGTNGWVSLDNIQFVTDQDFPE